MLNAEARLVGHPLTPCADFAVSVRLAGLAGGALECRYELAGDLGAIVVPAIAAPTRRDGLWRHTCFELFVARRGAAGYREFNFAPSGDWAAYEFSDYRVASSPPALTPPPMRTAVASARLTLTAQLAAAALPGPGDGALELGLAAVIELRGGALCYLALCHPAARPDFHDRRGFALALGPAAAR